MSDRAYARSFAGGELTPEFFGQITDAKYQTGLANCRNFRILPHGPAQNRTGSEYVATVKTPLKRTMVRPFTYSTTQTMVLQFGELYIRFHTLGANLLAPAAAAWNVVPTYNVGDLVSQGGITYYCIATVTAIGPPNALYWYPLPSTSYEIPTPYVEADLFDLHFVQSADVLTIVHPNYPPAELRRLGATTWTLVPIVFGTTLSPPISVTARATPGTTPTTGILHDYAVTAVASNNIDESLISTNATGTAVATLNAFTQANPGVGTTVAAHGLTPGDPVTITLVLGMTQINGASWTVNTTPSPTTLTLALAGVPVNTTGFGAYASGGSIFYTSGVKNNLLDTGAFNTITWPAVAGAKRYNVYKRSNGLWGYVGQADNVALTFTDNLITPNIGITPPEFYSPFTGAGNFPGAVSYFEQRRCFGGTVLAPSNLWLTRSATESNMTYHIPTQDADSINFRVVAREANTIRHLVPLTSLLALTSSAEWRVVSVNSDALTPSSASVKPQSAIGANNVSPVIVNNNVIYAAARGGHLREMAYNWQAGGYLTGDLSLRAPHLFDNLTIVDMAYSKSPYPVVWSVSSNGVLLGLTYVPEQQIGAVHHHDTISGSYESVCAVAEGNDDIVYVVVNRTLNGAQTRTVERFRSRAFATPSDAFFVDCGATYSGAAATVISGLTWLEGCTVSILADAAVVQPQVVGVAGGNPAGAITLATAASKVQVGLGITADLQTLPLAMMVDAAYGEGKKKNVNKAQIRVTNSAGIYTGPSLDRLVPYKQRTTEVYGTPPNLFTGLVEIVNKAAWTDDAQLYIRQTDPLPLTIGAIVLDVAVGG